MITSDVRVRVLTIALLLASATAAAPARAETDEQRAVTLFDKGRKLARDGHCAEAIAPLLESIRHAEGVGPLLNLGNCYETLGKTASAHRYFVRAREVAAARADARRDEAAQRARALEKDLPTLVLHVPGSIKSTAEVRIDGELWPRDRWDTPSAIDPGAHEIEVVAPPHPKHTETVTIPAKGDRVEWTASTGVTTPTLAPAPRVPAVATTPMEDRPAPAEAPSSTQRTIGLVVGGTGIAGLVTGAIFGVISLSAHSSLVGRCPTYPRCPSSDRAALEDMNTKAESTGTISTISVVAGLALIVGGALLFFTAAPRAETRASRATAP
jgi:hypothetical protein